MRQYFRINPTSSKECPCLIQFLLWQSITSFFFKNRKYLTKWCHKKKQESQTQEAAGMVVCIADINLPYLSSAYFGKSFNQATQVRPLPLI